SVPSEFYDRKLEWFERLAEGGGAGVKPTDPLMILGDFNVAPEDRDVWSPKAFVGSTHVTPAERAAVARLEEWGFVDAFRKVYDQERLYSYWDYRAGDFHQGRGMRIDLILA